MKFSDSATQRILQMTNAEQIEARIVARLCELQEQGVIRHVYQDEWEVLDWERYNEAMGVRT